MTDIPKLPATVLIELIAKTGKRQKWRWRATNAGNNETLAMSSEWYRNKQDCLDAITQLFGNNTDVYLKGNMPEMSELRLAKEWQ